MRGAAVNTRGSPFRPETVPESGRGGEFLLRAAMDRPGGRHQRARAPCLDPASGAFACGGRGRSAIRRGHYERGSADSPFGHVVAARSDRTGGDARASPILALPVKAHVYPHVPLAWALRAAGHEVCVVSQPDLVDEIAETGLTVVPVGEALNLGEGIKAMPMESDRMLNPWDLMKMAEFSRDDLSYNFVHGVSLVMTTLWTSLASGVPTW